MRCTRCGPLSSAGGSAERFGWQTFGRTDSEIDRWVELMGGWGDLTSRQRRDVRDALRTALGHGSSWQPGPTPTLTPGHPWYDADFGPRLAFERTGANWYSNHNVWYRAGGKAFFLNYWYRTFVAVSEETLDLVSRMPDPYAAMSHYEFFAELYALHYDVEDDRSAIPDDVAQWLDAIIGAPEPGPRWFRSPDPLRPASGRRSRGRGCRETLRATRPRKGPSGRVSVPLRCSAGPALPVSGRRARAFEPRRRPSTRRETRRGRAPGEREPLPYVGASAAGREAGDRSRTIPASRSS